MNKVYQRINWQNEPSIATPLNETNLNKIDYALDVVDGRVVTFDTTKANQSDLLQTVKTVAYNTTTGVFTFTFWNGNTVTADLNIEKIPVDFSMDEYGVITMTTADGTTYTCDISELIKLYTFNDSSEIDFTTTTDASGNKTITASIVSGSITGDKLQPNYLADCVSAKNGAESAETNAGQSATSSELSSQDSEAWAVGERNGQPVPSTDPAYENNAKWWAQHGTGSSFAGLSDTNFTNLQNGQIPKYDSATGMWLNVEDEGGLLPHFKITSEAGSTVTVVCPDTSVIVPTQTSSGIWQCDVPAYGVYTVHAVINGDDAVRSVTVDTVKEYVIHDEHYSYTLNVYAPTGSSILVTDNGDETYTGTGAGSTAVVFALHQASTTYTITVTYDGLDSETTITSSATSGGSGSKTITFGTINLTVDEDLIGETIVMAKGTDTVSKVASSTSMVFYPNATGNWRISVDYEGETVYAEPDPIVVSSLSTPVSAELSLVKIPEGATVTPTDDIQTWLACANITNKSYTTLAEVLADRDTFETLIADSNACDYMARSTSWALAEGAVPAMTSDTTPSGEVIKSGEFLSYASWKAFNQSELNGWTNDSTAPYIHADNYVGYIFPNNVGIASCDILWKYYNQTSTIKGKIQANIDNVWTDVTDEITIVSNSSDIPVHAWFTKNIGKYSSYRFICTVAPNNNYSYGIKLQFYEADITTNQDAMSLIGKYDYCSNELLSNATWASAIAESDYWDSVLNVSVPKMTSATTPSGEVIAPNQHSSYLGYYAFDQNTSTRYSPVSAGTFPDSVTYDFKKSVRIVKFSVMAGATGSIKDFQIRGSNDNNTWTTLYSGTYPNSQAVIEDVLTTIGDYRYYQIYQAETGYVNYLSVAELQFYGRASSSVSNTNGIIHTANGDTVTCNGNTYVADTNGIIDIDFSDFDEGTYTFTSGIAKDPTNLSNYYSKSFKITKSPYGGTTELYLMPDAVKTLYWYGWDSGLIEDCVSANGWSWSGVGLGTPTHNTNDITLSSAMEGVKSIINGTHKIVFEGVTAVAGVYGMMGATSSKAISGGDWTEVSTSGKLLLSKDISSKYAFVGSVNGRSSKIHAWWYE